MKRKTGTTNQAEAMLPTEWGTFIMSAHSEDHGDYTPHIVLRHPEMDVSTSVYTRVHSECITGEVFHSEKCDCGKQLNLAMALIEKHKGILIYLRQEGRGIGIINKIKAYKKQEKGLDTIAANQALGLEADYRKYDEAATILVELGISEVCLITNNPKKINDLNLHSITVTKRIPIVIPANEKSEAYLKTKENEMGHLLSSTSSDSK